MTTTAATSSTAGTGTQIKSSKNQLKTEDFIKMMVTQLQHQDPLEPAKNQELLAQMSQIGQLQSQTLLQTDLPYAAQVVAPATAGGTPSSLNPLLALGLAAVVGAILGLFLVFLLDALRRPET